MSALAGKRVCITGLWDAFDYMAAVDRIKAQGGTQVLNVDRTTDLLIAGEQTGSRQTVAQALGVPIVSLPEFMKG